MLFTSSLLEKCSRIEVAISEHEGIRKKEKKRKKRGKKADLREKGKEKRRKKSPMWGLTP